LIFNKRGKITLHYAVFLLNIYYILNRSATGMLR